MGRDDTSCFATARVSGHEHVGGLVGVNLSSITNCYTRGSVSGDERVGGLVGYSDFGGTITGCYSGARVTGTRDIGGLVGRSYGADDVTQSFWDVETSGQTASAGGVGVGKTTAEMQRASTFLEAGWDFAGETANGIDDIWWILEGKDYPRLTWELAGNEMEPQMNADGR